MATKEITTTRVHGRVNLIGEHTDYNGGFVLPTVIPQATSVTLTPMAGKRVGVTTSSLTSKQTLREESFELGEEKKTGTWIDYVQGAVKFMGERNSIDHGFSLSITSNVPEGVGLSSSAALGIAVLKTLREAFKIKLDDIELARMAQRVENDFVGARVGIMDPFACAMARENEALFIDTKAMTYDRVPLPTQKLELLVISSGIAHRHATGSYNQRRAECESACTILGLKSLRDLTDADYPSALSKLPDIESRRVRHVFTENARVLKAVRFLKESRVRELGELFYDSHRSMRDDYEVSIPEVDQLVELCRAEPHVIGARMTGGGFGGSIVALLQPGRALEVGRKVAEAYHEKTGENATVLVPEGAPA